MTPGRWGGFTGPQLLQEPCAMDGPLSVYPVHPDCSAAAGGVDQPADGSADTTPAAPARTPAPRRAACSRRSRPGAPPGSCTPPPPFVPDREAPVRVIHHLDLLAHEPARERRRVQQKHHPVVAQSEIAGDPLTEADDLNEILAWREERMASPIQTYSPNRSRAFSSKASGSRRCRTASSIRLRA